jgi:DNA-binding winged helix-turn-helix (wHTH) protein
LFFGPFEFDPVGHNLRKKGRAVPLDPQAAKLLAQLLEGPGRLFTYDEIQQRLWGGTVVEYNQGIRRCLTQIRAALGDNGKARVYIRTERGGGLRFIAPVRSLSDLNPDSPQSASMPEPPSTDRQEQQPPDLAVAVPVGEAASRALLSWVPRWALGGASIAILAVLVVAVLASAYGLAIFAFWLGGVFMILGYLESEDRPITRAVVAVYIILAMSYTASASTMPAFQATIVNARTLTPSAAFLCVMGLKFIPLVVLLLAYWVIMGACGDVGFLAMPALEKTYTLFGVLFLSMTLICAAWTSGDDHVWRAASPGRWTLAIGVAVVFAANVALWFAGRRCFRRERIVSHRPLFWLCAAAYLPIALGSYFIDDEHNRLNRYDLDVRWPEAYIAANPEAVSELDDLERSNLETQVGPDLRSLLHDAGFRDALRHGRFYRQHSDDPFQLFRRAVMFGYRPRSSSDGRPPFVVIRFPQEMADALRFQLVNEGK